MISIKLFDFHVIEFFFQFEHIFNLEETPPSTSNRRADVLIEYLRLVKKKSKTFHSCLHKDAWSIPLEYRCKLPPQNCDAHAK